MDDAPVVGVGEGGGDLLGDVEEVGDGQRPVVVPLQELAEVVPVEQFHHQVEHAVVFAEVVDHGHPAVLERGGDPGLAAETFTQRRHGPGVGLPSQRFEALDGDLAAQRLVPRPPHLTHATAADEVEQPVPALEQGVLLHRAPPPPLARCPDAAPGPPSMSPFPTNR